MGRLYVRYFDDGEFPIFICHCCRIPLARRAHLVSKEFRAQHGRAYLFDSVLNVELAPPTRRQLLTGDHLVADVSCTSCHNCVGWKYITAYAPSQKYKEGRYILERALVAKIHTAAAAPLPTCCEPDAPAPALQLAPPSETSMEDWMASGAPAPQPPSPGVGAGATPAAVGGLMESLLQMHAAFAAGGLSLTPQYSPPPSSFAQPLPGESPEPEGGDDPLFDEGEGSSEVDDDGEG